MPLIPLPHDDKDGHTNNLSGDPLFSFKALIVQSWQFTWLRALLIQRQHVVRVILLHWNGGIDHLVMWTVRKSPHWPSAVAPAAWAVLIHENIFTWRSGEISYVGFASWNGHSSADQCVNYSSSNRGVVFVSVCGDTCTVFHLRKLIHNVIHKRGQKREQNWMQHFIVTQACTPSIYRLHSLILSLCQSCRRVMVMKGWMMTVTAGATEQGLRLPDVM